MIVYIILGVLAAVFILMITAGLIFIRHRANLLRRRRLYEADIEEASKKEEKEDRYGYWCEREQEDFPSFRSTQIREIQVPLLKLSKTYRKKRALTEKEKDLILHFLVASDDITFPARLLFCKETEEELLLLWLKTIENRTSFSKKAFIFGLLAILETPRYERWMQHPIVKKILLHQTAPCEHYIGFLEKQYHVRFRQKIPEILEDQPILMGCYLEYLKDTDRTFYQQSIEGVGVYGRQLEKLADLLDKKLENTPFVFFERLFSALDVELTLAIVVFYEKWKKEQYWPLETVWKDLECRREDGFYKYSYSQNQPLLQWNYLSPFYQLKGELTTAQAILEGAVTPVAQYIAVADPLVASQLSIAQEAWIVFQLFNEVTAQYFLKLFWWTCQKECLTHSKEILNAKKMQVLYDKFKSTSYPAVFNFERTPLFFEKKPEEEMLLEFFQYIRGSEENVCHDAPSPLFERGAVYDRICKAYYKTTGGGVLDVQALSEVSFAAGIWMHWIDPYLKDLIAACAARPNRDCAPAFLIEKDNDPFSAFVDKHVSFQEPVWLKEALRALLFSEEQRAQLKHFFKDQALFQETKALRDYSDPASLEQLPQWLRPLMAAQLERVKPVEAQGRYSGHGGESIVPVFMTPYLIDTTAYEAQKRAKKEEEDLGDRWFVTDKDHTILMRREHYDRQPTTLENLKEVMLLFKFRCQITYKKNPLNSKDTWVLYQEHLKPYVNQYRRAPFDIDEEAKEFFAWMLIYLVKLGIKITKSIAYQERVYAVETETFEGLYPETSELKAQLLLAQLHNRLIWRRTVDASFKECGTMFEELFQLQVQLQPFPEPSLEAIESAKHSSTQGVSGRDLPVRSYFIERAQRLIKALQTAPGLCLEGAWKRGLEGMIAQSMLKEDSLGMLRKKSLRTYVREIEACYQAIASCAAMESILEHSEWIEVWVKQLVEQTQFVPSVLEASIKVEQETGLYREGILYSRTCSPVPLIASLTRDQGSNLAVRNIL